MMMNAVYSQVLIYTELSELGHCGENETVANGDSNPGSLDCESGILPHSKTPNYLHTASQTHINLMPVSILQMCTYRQYKLLETQSSLEV